MPPKKNITDQQMRWLCNNGRKRFTLNQLAVKLNVDNTTVAGYLKARKLRAVTRRHQITAKIIKYAAKGKFYSINKICELLSTSPQTVHAIIKEYSLYPTSKKSVANRRFWGKEIGMPPTQEQIKAATILAIKNGCKMLAKPKTKGPSRNEKMAHVQQMIQQQKRAAW